MAADSVRSPRGGMAFRRPRNLMSRVTSRSRRDPHDIRADHTDNPCAENPRHDGLQYAERPSVSSNSPARASSAAGLRISAPEVIHIRRASPILRPSL